MNKKQVATLLKIMPKNDLRPAFNAGYIDEWEGRMVMVVTNGYMMSIVYLTDDLEEFKGKLVRREAIEKWYKLANAKDSLASKELMHVISEDYADHNGWLTAEFPKWKQVMPRDERKAQDNMIFNAEFFKHVQDFEMSDGVDVLLYGRLAPMVVKGTYGTYVVMPKKV